jgi:hypothetical protein
MTCPTDRFGAECGEFNGACDHSTGQCSCKEGYEGVACDEVPSLKEPSVDTKCSAAPFKATALYSSTAPRDEADWSYVTDAKGTAMDKWYDFASLA